jgi:hypothetical protein
LPYGVVENAMPEKALDQPLHLNIHPDEPERSLDVAASGAFRRWAKDEGLLLVPPEDALSSR